MEPMVVINPAIKEWYDAFNEVVELARQEPSLSNTLNSIFQKNLLLACASDLEVSFKRALAEILERHSDKKIRKFIEAKVLDRKWHELFDWDRGGATVLFSNFGFEKKKFELWLNEGSDTEYSNRDFHEAFRWIGATRNRMVHTGFVTCDIGNSPNDIWEKYKLANRFINSLEELLYPNSEVDV